MPGSPRTFDPAAPSAPPPSPHALPPTAFDRIPLPVRMVAYGAAFLAFVLGVVPFAAYQLDVYVPAMRINVGPLQWLGVPLFVIFLAIYLYSSYVLTNVGRGAYVEFDPPKQFVAVGPFRWCRNPIAGSLLGAILGEALALSSTGILLLFVMGLPLAHIQVVLLEEPLLKKRFGAAYEAYLQSVPRWLPRPPRRSAT